MQVRPARPEEADEIARQYARMAEEGWIAGEPPVDLAERTERFRASIDAGTTLVLEIDGRLAGFGGVNTTHARGVVTFGMAVMPKRAERAEAGHCSTASSITHAGRAATRSRSRACVATTTAARTDRCAQLW